MKNLIRNILCTLYFVPLYIYFVPLCITLAGCEGTTFQSSVPAYPVRVVIDTRVFVNFKPEHFGSYITVNRDGYFENDKFVMPVNAMDAYGYGGVVVYVGMFGYTAYDLACPYCAAKGKKSPCVVDGMYAECLQCEEKYDLGGGYALPQNGLSKEALRKLRIINTDGKLTITQGQ